MEKRPLTEKFSKATDWARNFQIGIKKYGLDRIGKDWNLVVVLKRKAAHQKLQKLQKHTENTRNIHKKRESSKCAVLKKEKVSRIKVG
jgi:hypothetical protein